MNAIVVYESVWGNTAAIARAIAEGLGEGTRALSTAEATADALAGADLIVAGSPVLGFSVPNDHMIEGIRANPGNPPGPTDLSQPSMRSWLDALKPGTAACAAFETRIWWSPGGATKGILKTMEAAGYHSIGGKGERFIVTGKYGPLKDGEVERARAWGRQLAEGTKS
jgi:flavodoxin